jgi:hypothetical protein
MATEVGVGCRTTAGMGVGVGGMGVGVGVIRTGARDQEKKLTNKMAMTTAAAVAKMELKLK